MVLIYVKRKNEEVEKKDECCEVLRPYQGLGTATGIVIPKDKREKNCIKHGLLFGALSFLTIDSSYPIRCYRAFGEGFRGEAPLVECPVAAEGIP